MKYRCEVVVNLPRSKFIELFDDPSNMPKWMPGLQTFEPISGTPGQPGAKSRLVFLMGKRTIEMIEYDEFQEVRGIPVTALSNQ